MTAVDQQPGPSAQVPMPRKRPWLILAPLGVFTALALMFGYALTAGDPSKVPSALIGRPAPVTPLPAMQGLVAKSGGGAVPGIATADLQAGEVKLVNYFASWCIPCVQEHPVLVELAARSGVKIYGVNYKDPAPGGLRFLERYGNPYIGVGVDDSGRAGIEWGVYGMPETFIVDAQGRIAYKHIGPMSQDAMNTVILPKLAAERAKAK
jgi:cytochrome c biogenesis protein CcmG/thiol:disulfide interchange protein DsbE